MKDNVSLDASSQAVQLPPSELSSIDMSQESIANLAYSIWQSRGCPIGSSDQDWLEAEQALRATPKTMAASAGRL